MPTSVLFGALALPISGVAALGIGFATEVYSTYSAAGLNPKKLIFEESQYQHKLNSQANKYILYWLDTYGNKINRNTPQIRYLTIG